MYSNQEVTKLTRRLSTIYYRLLTGGEADVNQFKEIAAVLKNNHLQKFVQVKDEYSTHFYKMLKNDEALVKIAEDHGMEDADGILWEWQDKLSRAVFFDRTVSGFYILFRSAGHEIDSTI